MIDENLVRKIDALFLKYDQPDSPGFAAGILDDQGEFLYCKGFGHANLEHPSPINQNSVFDIGSMAKQFTGFLIALLIDEGKISLSQNVSTFFPSWGDFYKNIQIQHLLSHSSGIWNYTTICYYIIGYHENDAPTRDEVFSILKRQTEGKFPPGSTFEYNDSNYFLLTLIIEQVQNRPID